jgi:16S rRNA (guanine1207-N2)-methyltransferase
MPQQHYFSEQPQTDAKTHSVEFELEGTVFNLTAASGTFSSTRLDSGTRVLLKESALFPDSGTVLDIGCGWGPISLAVATLRPETEVFGLDVNSRSLELAQANAAALKLKNFKAVRAEQIPNELLFDGIWSNPPIRVGKAVLHQLMRTWIPRLKPGASAMLVVQKQLGAESFQKWLAESFTEFDVAKQSIDKGYRVIRVTNSAKPQ